jgi:hypothetical protein
MYHYNNSKNLGKSLETKIDALHVIVVVQKTFLRQVKGNFKQTSKNREREQFEKGERENEKLFLLCHLVLSL